MRVKTITESLAVNAGATWNSPIFKLETAPWEDFALIQWSLTTGGNPPQIFTIYGRPTPTSPWGSVYNNAALSDMAKITFCPEYYISIIAPAAQAITAGSIYIGR